MGIESQSKPPGPTEERQVVWEIVAQFWVDTWYDDEQLERFADRLAACGFSADELDRIVLHEVCGAFALFTLGVFLSFGMALPDWYYPDEEARQKVGDWLEKPRLYSYLNPFWTIGLFSARWFIREDWAKLKLKVGDRARPKG